MARTVFVTGASRGIGLAAARRFHDDGWNVIATMRSPDAVADAAPDLATSPRMHVVRLDVTDESSIREAVAAGLDRFGEIDVLVNNAAFGVYGPLEASPLDSARRLFETNVIGLLAVTKAMLPHFRRRRSGTLVNLSSIGGRTVFPLGALYHGSKFAIEGISEALVFECEAIGVTVKIVEPGSVATGFTRSLEFCNDESIDEYQPLVANLVRYSPRAADSIDAAAVADVVFEAATDGRDRLRYLVGDDAEEAWDVRRQADDAEYLAWVRRRFRLVDVLEADR